jgi:hypothetical protein
MSTATLTTTTLTLAALAFAAASQGCGTDAQQPRPTQPVPTARPTGAQTDEQAIARHLDGLYTASIRGPGLRGAPGIHVPAGLWALRIDVAGRALRLIPPEGGDITLRLTAVDASRLRLAPDIACESRAGRTVGTRLSWLRTATSLRLEAVRAPCRSDATVLTSSPWLAVWPATPLTPTAPAPWSTPTD